MRALLRADAENHNAHNHRVRQLPHDERVRLGDDRALKDCLEHSESRVGELVDALAAAR